MRVVVDTSMLLLFLRPSTPAPRDRDGKPVPKHAGERVKYLITNLEASNATDRRADTGTRRNPGAGDPPGS